MPFGFHQTCACMKIKSIDNLKSIRQHITRLPKQPQTQGKSPDELSTLQARCPTGLFWTVGPGDTFFSIARTTGTTIQRIIALNPQIDPETLQIGMQVCLPEETALPRGPIPPCPSGLYWVVSQGDTLFTIATAFGTTVERLLELNPGIDPLNLQIGMSICLPG